jgi:hypothetical protein
MQFENLTRIVLNDDELAALYEVCATALEHNLLDGIELAFAMAIVETLQEPDSEQSEAEPLR